MLVLLHDEVRLEGAGVVLLGPRDEVEDVGESLRRVLVTPHHQIAESNIVEGGDVARSHSGEQALFLFLVGWIMKKEAQTQKLTLCIRSMLLITSKAR